MQVAAVIAGNRVFSVGDDVFSACASGLQRCVKAVGLGRLAGYF